MTDLRRGIEYEEVCDFCGTHCGGTEGQSVWREKEFPGGAHIICGECDDNWPGTSMPTDLHQRYGRDRERYDRFGELRKGA